MWLKLQHMEAFSIRFCTHALHKIANVEPQTQQTWNHKHTQTYIYIYSYSCGYTNQDQVMHVISVSEWWWLLAEIWAPKFFCAVFFLLRLALSIWAPLLLAWINFNLNKVISPDNNDTFLITTVCRKWWICAVLDYCIILVHIAAMHNW